MPRPPDTSLIGGPYHAPALRKGDRATCLYRGREVKVTGWTDAPIPWPKGVPVGGRGRPSLVVDGELLRAIRTESAGALRRHWGVSPPVVSLWRRAFGVGRAGTPGSRRLVRAAARKAGDAARRRAKRRRVRRGG